ncbi:MAG: DNA internalization-related competence protein ComEC/Rec2 [Proteobacteria bacterium]|nr:DNA internalization-related competence protein ComEC/Rec2 [Pseudomonadota bacterium]
MRLVGLCFVVGALCGLVTAARPALLCCLLLLSLLPCWRRWRLLALWLCLAAGSGWALWAKARAEHELLPRVREDQALVIGARVTGFPMPGRAGVVLELGDVQARGTRHAPLPTQARVSWRHASYAPRLGDWCELHVRLRRPRGLANPGGRDVERAALVKHLGASGHVVAHPGNRCEHIATRRDLAGLRAWLSRDIARAVVNPRAVGPLKALAVDDRSALDDAQWQVMRRTGTAHLLAISGLQITLAAGTCFALCRWLLGLVWAWRQDYLVLRAAWVASALCAWAYTCVAGAGVPSVRAAVMVAFAAIAALRGRRAVSWDTWLASLTVLVAWDPLCLLGSGLWLSFGAVAVLVALAGHRERLSPWRLAWRTHVIMAIALTPLTALLFGEVPWCAPLANLIAVPWSNVLVVPLVLLGMVCAPLAPMAAALAWDCAARLWTPLEALLTWMAQAPTWQLHHELGLVGGALWSVGLALLALPRAVAGRWLGALLLTIVLVPRERPLRDGEFRVLQLDVGQGLAVLVRTRHHALLYDAGPRWFDGGDAGESVVVPALRALGVQRLDALVVSHADLDHAGGAASLLARVPVARVLTGEAIASLGAVATETCHAPLTWSHDGVVFEVLHPHPGARNAPRNDSSCVLRVRGAHGRALLAGDIGIEAERELLARGPSALAAEVLSVPHHGSSSSSSPRFVDAVHPRLALIAAGHLNRYRLPRDEVVARYRAGGARVMNGAELGAIEVEVASDGLHVESYRARHWGWWHHRPP